MQQLLSEIRACTACSEHLPLGARPVLRATSEARILLVGQAPGTRVHATGIPWNDPSGDRLRDWLQMDKTEFYDETKMAIVPMGFCYPGKGKSGDLPPRPECAALWRAKIHAQLPNIRLTILIGAYANAYYLREQQGKTLTATVENWQAYLPDFFPLVHPSPRNRFWLSRHPWFEEEVVPALRLEVENALR